VSPESARSAVSATAPDFRTGTIAIVGRPNVGKSTLLNRLIGQKLSITSRKAQTTRHRITGVLTQATRQFIFVDTPGFQVGHKGALNRMMNRTVKAALSGVDAILFVVEAARYTSADRLVTDFLPLPIPTILVINKVDRVDDKTSLLAYIQERVAEREFAEIVPVSAKTGSQCDDLLDAIGRYLPVQPPLFDADTLTDRNERFLVSELIREKVFRLLGDELPYTCTVVIDQFKEEPLISGIGERFCRIEATLLVGRAGHKAMIIGRDGAKLKEIGTEARIDIERLLGARAHLGLWVKVKSGWADNEANLKSYGYE
jgi:GTP-binding protein Era